MAGPGPAIRAFTGRVTLPIRREALILPAHASARKVLDGQIVIS